MTAVRTVLVVNPMSQSGGLGRRWASLAPMLRRELGAFEEVQTAAPGDATRLTREALRGGADRVVAIGGDGTVNEVVNGFFDGDAAVAPAATLGVLPFGTGGDFRRTLGIPNDLERAARLLVDARPRRIDIGRLSYTERGGATATRRFANIASFGISGLVDEYVNKSSKRLGGKLSFMLATARAGLKYQNQRVRLVFDGDEAGGVEVTINTVAVANGRYFGGGMFVAPQAELDDGLFDVVAMGDLSLKDLLFNGTRIYKGTHLTMDKVTHRRARTVTATPVDGALVMLDVDGETPGILPATFTLAPQALAVLMPA